MGIGYRIARHVVTLAHLLETAPYAKGCIFERTRKRTTCVTHSVRWGDGCFLGDRRVHLANNRAAKSSASVLFRPWKQDGRPPVIAVCVDRAAALSCSRQLTLTEAEVFDNRSNSLPTTRSLVVYCSPASRLLWPLVFRSSVPGHGYWFSRFVRVFSLRLRNSRSVSVTPLMSHVEKRHPSRPRGGKPIFGRLHGVSSSGMSVFDHHAAFNVPVCEAHRTPLAPSRFPELQLDLNKISNSDTFLQNCAHVVLVLTVVRSQISVPTCKHFSLRLGCFELLICYFIKVICERFNL